jgi:hypothetical protein
MGSRKATSEPAKACMLSELKPVLWKLRYDCSNTPTTKEPGRIASEASRPDFPAFSRLSRCYPGEILPAQWVS